MVSILTQSTGKLFDQVIAIHKKNTATLGFLPRGAFEEKAKVGKILIYLEGSDVLGYLLYDINGRNQLAYIVHLCVDRRHQRKQIAKRLFQYFEKHLQGMVGGIRVRCRVDYEASKLWPTLGFQSIGVTPGRKKGGSELEIWRKNLSFPDLFNVSEPEPRKLRAALDYNVLADMEKKVSDATIGAHTILADWLTEIVELFITPEFYGELQRDENKERRHDLKKLASVSFSTVTGASDEHDQASILMKDLFSNSTQDRSDLSHLAWCAVGGIDFFVTSDDGLQRKSAKIYDRVGVRVLHPSEFVNNIHFYLEATEYQPQRFNQTEIVFDSLKTEELDVTVSSLAIGASEGKRKLRDKLRSMIGDPARTKTLRLLQNEQILAVLCLNESVQDCLTVRFLRIPNMRLENTIAVAVINWLIRECVVKGLHCIRVEDNHMSPAVVHSLFKFGFRSFGGRFIRWVTRGRKTIDELITLAKSRQLESLLSVPYCTALRQELERVRGTGDDSLLFRLEKLIWPMKIKDLRMPCYIVSIRPQYALHLFDTDLSAQDLFGGNPAQLLNYENAYYKSQVGTKLEAPARILWYVSKGRGKHQDVMALRAVSYLDEVHEDTAKTLFGRFQHLGIYTWRDVLDAAHGDEMTPLVAFTFSASEILDRKIDRNQLNEVFQQERGCNFNIYSPVKISDTMYWKLYDLGQKSDLTE